MFLPSVYQRHVIRLSLLVILLILQTASAFAEAMMPRLEGDYAFIQQDTHNTFSEIFIALKKITPLAVINWRRFFIDTNILGIKLVSRKKARIFQIIPAPLIVVIAGVFMNMLLQNGSSLFLHKEQLVNIPQANSTNEFLSFFTLPDFSFITLPEVWITGLTIAIVASLESLLNIEAADKLDPYKRVTPTDRELKAQGIGNMVCGLVGGLPVTSVVVRTSANINGGT